jgi:hypothetical protein
VFVFWVTQVPLDDARREWQAAQADTDRKLELRRREVELEARLAREISDNDGRWFGSMQEFGLDRNPGAVLAFDRAFAAWRSTSHALASELRVYFPGATVAPRFENYLYAMQYVYSVVRRPAIGRPAVRLRVVGSYLYPPDSGTSNIAGLLHQPFDSAGAVNSTYQNALGRLITDLRAKQTTLIGELLEAKPSLRDPESEAA